VKVITGSGKAFVPTVRGSVFWTKLKQNINKATSIIPEKLKI
jgi:hypothetical protein